MLMARADVQCVIVSWMDETVEIISLSNLYKQIQTFCVFPSFVSSYINNIVFTCTAM